MIFELLVGIRTRKFGSTQNEFLNQQLTEWAQRNYTKIEFPCPHQLLMAAVSLFSLCCLKFSCSYCFEGTETVVWNCTKTTVKSGYWMLIDIFAAFMCTTSQVKAPAAVCGTVTLLVSDLSFLPLSRSFQMSRKKTKSGRSRRAGWIQHGREGVTGTQFGVWQAS